MIGFASPDPHETIRNVTGTFGETHTSTVKDGASRRITGRRYLEVSHLDARQQHVIVAGQILTRMVLGSAWSFDELTEQYYLRLFCHEQPDLNWDNPQVALEVEKIMRFWLDKGVDGFRMDVINLISKVPGLPDAPITVEGQLYQPGYMHYACGPRLHEHLRGLRRILDEYDAFAVGEMPWVKNEKDVMDVVSADRKELNMIFQFDM